MIAVLVLAAILVAEYRALAQECLVDGKPCENGGVCMSYTNMPPYCKCSDDSYYGQNCQYKVEPDPFCSIKGICGENGYCIKAGDGLDAYCMCKPGYYGTYCNIYVPKDEFCAVKGRCGPNGHCVVAGDGFPAFCACDNGYTGTSCESAFSGR